MKGNVMPVKPGVILQKEQYLHFRNKINGKVTPHGGATVCYSPQDELMSISICSSHDLFCKRKGRKIAKAHLRSPLWVKDARGLTFDQLVQEANKLVAEKKERLIHHQTSRLDRAVIRLETELLKSIGAWELT